MILASTTSLKLFQPSKNLFSKWELSYLIFSTVPVFSLLKSMDSYFWSVRFKNFLHTNYVNLSLNCMWWSHCLFYFSYWHVCVMMQSSQDYLSHYVYVWGGVHLNIYLYYWIFLDIPQTLISADKKRSDIKREKKKKKTEIGRKGRLC